MLQVETLKPGQSCRQAAFSTAQHSCDRITREAKSFQQRMPQEVWAPRQAIRARRSVTQRPAEGPGCAARTSEPASRAPGSEAPIAATAGCQAARMRRPMRRETRWPPPSQTARTAAPGSAAAVPRNARTRGSRCAPVQSVCSWFPGGPRSINQLSGLEDEPAASPPHGTLPHHILPYPVLLCMPRSMAETLVHVHNAQACTWPAPDERNEALPTGIRAERLDLHCQRALKALALAAPGARRALVST